MNEYLIRLATINEYKDALRYRELYMELCESFKGIMEEVFRYCERNNIELPERAFVNRTMEKASELIERKVAYSTSRGVTGRKSDEDVNRAMHRSVKYQYFKVRYR